MKFKYTTAIGLLIIAVLSAFPACKTRKENTGYLKIDPVIDNNIAAKHKSNILNINNDIFKAAEYTGLNKTTIKYRLLTPLNAKKEANYPLVLVLHGSGAIGTDNNAQLGVLAKLWALDNIREKYPAYIVAPQFPVRSSNYLPDSDYKILASVPDPCLTSALQLIDSLKKMYNINKRKIYVIGFSMGASGAINSLNLRPDLFAAAVSISGIPEFKHLDILAKTPVWFIHGNADPENPITSDSLLLKTLQQLHAPKIRYWEISGFKHEVYPELYTTEAIPEWLFKQQRPQGN